MARRRKSRKKKSRLFPAAILCLGLAGAAGGWLWHEGYRPDFSLARFESLKARFVNLWPGGGTNHPRHSPAPRQAEPPPAQAAPEPKPELKQAPPVSAEPRTESPPPAEETSPPRPVRNILEAQIALARRGISTGCIDGSFGEQTRRALFAYQLYNNLPVSGELDTETKEALRVEEPLFIWHSVSSEDLERLMDIPPTWLGKSQAPRLDYESILEMVAEKGRASTFFVRSLNPGMDWDRITPGTLIKIPRVDEPPVPERAAFVRIHLYSKTLDVFGAATNLLAHYPCSIAARVEKRPIGRMAVANAADDPNYLFNPAIFSESAEARRIGRKLVIPPGPNNPVGAAWIGLDKPGYGIHGTPKPELVGRTESHGCFRLANWNAEHLLKLVWKGMPVIVEP